MERSWHVSRGAGKRMMLQSGNYRSVAAISKCGTLVPLGALEPGFVAETHPRRLEMILLLCAYFNHPAALAGYRARHTEVSTRLILDL